MKIMKRSVLIAFALCFIGISSADAEVFYWQDPHTKMSVTYPDVWREIHDQKADDVWTVVAPGADAMATCRMRVRKDRRFVIYPQRFSDNIQHVAFSRDFWEDYLGEYEGYTLHGVNDDAGLGRGFASWADASYITSAAPKMQKRALMFVSLYYDTAYIFECSAQEEAYADWHRPFLNVLHSVDFRKIIHELPSGHYRNFLGDGRIRINGAREIDVTYY